MGRTCGATGLGMVLLLVGAGAAGTTTLDKVLMAAPKRVAAPASPTRPAAPNFTSVALPGRPGWTVDARNGCWLWNSVPAPGETVRWNGACPSGPAEGEGAGEWRAGAAGAETVEAFSGTLRNGRLHGRATYAWASGNRYEGDFVESVRHGRGTMTWGNGDRYVGEWRDGARSGRGVMTFAGGNRYDGEWRADRPDGFGTLTTADNTTSIGTWRAGCFNDLRRRHAIGRPASECP